MTTYELRELLVLTTATLRKVRGALRGANTDNAEDVAAEAADDLHDLINSLESDGF